MTRYFESSLIRLAVAAVVLCVALPIYAAQPTVRGVVTDPLGADVANARVELVAVQNVQMAGYTFTDAQGRYSLSPTQPGRYVLRVSANGFDVTYSHELYLRAGQPAYQDIALQLGKLAQSVTVTATGTATPQSQTGASVTVLDQTLYPHTQDMQDTLRMVNGLQFSTTGQRGATTSLFELGGNSNQTAVMVDGVPINDIGGAVNLAYLAANGINQAEIFRGPDSALYGADASAGVINLMTTRGTTTRPLVTYSVDGGNYGTYRQEGSLGGVHNALDYYSNFARFDTANSYPNSSFHNGSFAGNFGYAITPHTQLRATVRRVAAASGEPNALLFYGIADTQYLKEHDLTSGVTLEDHATNALHFMAQYGMLRLRSLNTDPSPAGVLIDNPNNFNCYDNAGNPGAPEYVGLPVTITGGNGYTVSGRAFYNNCANSSFPGTDGTLTNRDFFYGQSDYTVNPKLVVFTAFRYESERGYTAYDYAQQSANRGNFDYIVQTSGNLGSRLYYSGGADLPNYSVFGFEPAPRGTVAYYLVKPSASGIFAGTKARFNFSKGILEPTIAEQRGSIYDVLQTLPNGQSLITKNGITPVGAQMARTYEGGVDQQLLGNRAVVHAGYFHNEFGNQIEFVYASALSQLGVPPAVVQEIANTSYGAYINSLSFRAQGLETSMEYRVSSRIFARGGYTYLNANVQHSFSSDNEFPSINPKFPTIQIGAYSPLIGQRPFRRAPQSGFFSVTYAEPRWYAMVTGTTVGARDDSTFLLDANGGNTLLLPNHNLDPGYENIGLNVSYQINKHASAYGVVDNLLSQHYQQVIGYPSLPFNFRSGIEVSLGGAKPR
ncbi:MAG TPA: carboxypeptidase regulatory-like domain-containing protein [Acidobacteriaceae bacterium]|jgi:iron complex outermembrane receptor protein/vitamin B12 transporter|nr:carboxypeptidase regulatory-like domain-containing protein [Acidobacteriaceae bacterium]